MTTNYVCISRTFSIKQAMRSLIAQASENDNISNIYVEDEEGHFYGVIDLQKLIIARAGSDLEELIQTSYPFVFADEKIGECIEDLKKYEEDSIPVLNRSFEIEGVITPYDIIEASEDEMGEDYAKFAGLTEEEELDENILHSLRKRLPWLTILLFLATCVSVVAGFFEHVVAEVTLIVSFQSLILGMSGNVGTQSLAVTIRTITEETLNQADKVRLDVYKRQVYVKYMIDEDCYTSETTQGTFTTNEDLAGTASVKFVVTGTDDSLEAGHIEVTGELTGIVGDEPAAIDGPLTAVVYLSLIHISPASAKNPQICIRRRIVLSEISSSMWISPWTRRIRRSP